MVIDCFIVKIQVILNSSDIDQVPAVIEPLGCSGISAVFKSPSPNVSFEYNNPIHGTKTKTPL